MLLLKVRALLAYIVVVRAVGSVHRSSEPEGSVLNTIASEVHSYGEATPLFSVANDGTLDLLPHGSNRLFFGQVASNNSQTSDYSQSRRIVESVIIRYADFHASHCRQQDAALYVMYRCSAERKCAGYSDRLRGMFSVLRLAMVLGRCFILDIAQPVGILDVLLPKSIDWRPPEGLGMPERYHRWGTRNFEKQTAGDPENLKSEVKHSQGPQSKVIIIETNSIWRATPFHAPEYLQQPTETGSTHQFRLTADELKVLDKLRQPEVQAIAHNFLFRTRTPGRLLSVHHMLSTARAWGKHLISLHFRTGDKALLATDNPVDFMPLKYTDEYLQTILAPIVKASARCGGLSVFVASDSVVLVGRVMALLPEHIQGLHCCSKPYHVGWMRRPSELNTAVKRRLGVSSMEQLLIDIEMFAHSTVILGEGEGNFASMGVHWALQQPRPFFRKVPNAEATAFLDTLE